LRLGAAASPALHRKRLRADKTNSLEVTLPYSVLGPVRYHLIGSAIPLHPFEPATPDGVTGHVRRQGLVGSWGLPEAGLLTSVLPLRRDTLMELRLLQSLTTRMRPQLVPRLYGASHEVWSPTAHGDDGVHEHHPSLASARYVPPSGFRTLSTACSSNIPDGPVSCRQRSWG
jgi:hypothetical protein